jgi:hypothetical protein
LQFVLRMFVWACIGFSGAEYARLMREYPEIAEPLLNVGVMLFVTLVVIVAMPVLSQFAMRKQLIAAHGAFLSRQTVSLSDTSVRLTSATGTTEVLWSSMLWRGDDDANHYLFVDEAQALILPRAAMTPLADELERYIAHIKKAA